VRFTVWRLGARSWEPDERVGVSPNPPIPQSLNPSIPESPQLPKSEIANPSFSPVLPILEAVPYTRFEGPVIKHFKENRHEKRNRCRSNGRE
jgi:hypothetical protein